jgi:hypothetical protein
VGVGGGPENKVDYNFKNSHLRDMSDSIPYLVPTHFQDLVFSHNPSLNTGTVACCTFVLRSSLQLIFCCAVVYGQFFWALSSLSDSFCGTLK